MPTAYARHAVADISDSDFLEEADEPYAIRLTDEAVYAYSEIASDKIFDRTGFPIGFLADHPYHGEAYDPYYKAATPPIGCRVFFCAHYGVYYTIDPEERLINVIAIVDERRDPSYRFRSV